MSRCARYLSLAWTLLGASSLRLAAQRPMEQPPVLTAFTIDGGAAVVSATDTAIALTHSVVGAHPGRVSREPPGRLQRREMASIHATPSVRDWYDPNGESCDATRPSHRVAYYFQVRTTLGEEVKVADGQRRIVPARVESNVLRATVCAYVPPTPNSTPAARPRLDATQPAELLNGQPLMPIP